MKLAYVSTYPPRACGLATFNKSLINAIAANLPNGLHGETVVAVNDEDHHDYPSEVKFVIRQQAPGDYIKAADFINDNRCEACILQHEFGIYGGDDGAYILSFIRRLEKPLITILHTVLEQPSYRQKAVLQNITKRSGRIVVMGRKAVNLLRNIYKVPSNKIAYIEHGAPDLEVPVTNPVKSQTLFRDRKTLLTFGLLSRNKGLETVIHALPKIAEHHPDVLYVILGATHPGIVKQSGEAYRESLIALAKKLNVYQNVAFVNHFVSEDDLMNYIAASDIYVSPYLHEAQVTSGTLAYAIGAGAAVVATPYWHAIEILADGRGRIFDFRDDRALAETIIELLNDPAKIQYMKEKAYDYGRRLKWPVIGKKYMNLIKTAVQKSHPGARLFKRTSVTAAMAECRAGNVSHPTA